MFNFISFNLQHDVSTSPKQEKEDEIKSSEAFQGDAAVILKVNELNELRKFCDELN